LQSNVIGRARLYRSRKISHFVIPNGVCGVRNLSFPGFAAPLCDVMREGMTLVVP